MDGLRPLGIGELLDAAFKIYQGRAKTLLAAVAIPVVPVVVLSVLITASAVPDLGVDPNTGAVRADGGDLAVSLAATLLSSFAIIIASSVATAACYRSISGAYVGDDPDWRESLRFGFKRLWSVLGLTFLTSLATVAGLLVCCFGVLWPLAFFSVAMPVLLVEGQGVVASMGRSRRLVTGMGWRTLGVVLLSTILAGIFQSVLSAPLVALFFADVSPGVEQVVNGVVQAITTVLVTPFTAALVMALYVDLRVRKEGFDLFLWAQRLGSAPAGGFPAQPGAPELPPGWNVPGGPGAGWGSAGYQPPPPGFPPAGTSQYPQYPRYPQQPGGPYQPSSPPPPPPPPPPPAPPV
ncbi:MAG: hypothetical protein ABIP03_06750, partial [Aquihabitans sp.]